MKDERYFNTQTPPELAKQLIDKIPLVKGDVVWEPFAGEGAFFNNFPAYVHKDWCELRRGRDFFRYTKPVDWVITCPPFNDDDHKSKSYVWGILSHLLEKDLVRKGMAFLLNKECYMSLTPLRIEKLEKHGYTIRKHVVCNLRMFRGRFMFVIITRNTTNIPNESFEPFFDYILGAWPAKPVPQKNKDKDEPPPPPPTKLTFSSPPLAK